MVNSGKPRLLLCSNAQKTLMKCGFVEDFAA
jgi:hypothetical protein